MNESEVKSIIAAAYVAQPAFAALPGTERIRLLETLRKVIEKKRDMFATAISAETNKSFKDALGEVEALLERMEYVMQDAREMFGMFIPSGWSPDTKDRMAIVTRVPLGVIAVIGPFNYPLFIPAAKAIPALLAGNAVVLKPSSYTPSTMQLFEEAVHEAGIPKEVFQVVVGSGSEVGQMLVSSSLVAAISFTGSTEVGEQITRTAGVKRLHLELGGKGVAIVFDDADLHHAARQVVEGALKNAGQRCDAVSVVYYVGQANYDQFVEHVVNETKRWTDERGGQPESLISDTAVSRINSLIADATSKGARMKTTFSWSDDHHMFPLVLDCMPHCIPLDARILKEETFGPVIPIVRVSTEAEAIKLHNSLPFGLDSSVFTGDLGHGLAVASKLRTGSVTINAYPKHGIGFFPFGGTKQSGVGREGVGYTIEEVTELKTIVIASLL